MLLSTPALLSGLFVMNKINNYKVGDKFYDRTYIGGEKKISGRKCILCKCKCGKEKRVRIYDIEKGNSKRCHTCPTHSGGLTHGLSYNRFYHIRRGILQRCNNKNSNTFKNYGAKGIKCLWNSFEEFKNDMYDLYINHVEQYGEHETTIDRIDSSGNYCKENCRRATRKEQYENKKNKTVGNTGMTAKELSNKYGFTLSTIYTYSYKYKDKLIDYLENKILSN